MTGLNIWISPINTFGELIQTLNQKTHITPDPEYQAEEPLMVPIDSPDRKRLPPLMRRSWYSLNQAFRRRLIHLKLTPDQFTVLRTLIESEEVGLPQCDISRRMSSDPNTIASLVERMEKLKLVSRSRKDGDRRVKLIRITPHGEQIYQKARDIAVALQSEVLSSLPASRRESFLNDLETISNACRKALEDS
jgi:DNA-binding MarR family transcriptional regulator